MTERKSLESERAELVALNEWMREPDYAENFSLADMTNWINRRPIATAARLAAPDHGGADAGVRKALQELRDANMSYSLVSNCVTALRLEQAMRDADAAIAQPQGDGEAVDLRDLVLQQIKRARKAGESQEMLARWICEVVRPLTYAPPTEAKDKELAALREEKVRFYSHNPYSEHNEVLKARAETAERRVAESEASWRETLRKERDSGLNATRLKEQFKRERDEAREALKAEPTTAMIDAGVAFALNVSLPGEYRWSQYVADLYKTMRDAATRAAIKQGE